MKKKSTELVSQTFLVPLPTSSDDTSTLSVCDNPESIREDNLLIRDKIYTNVSSEDIEAICGDLDSIVIGPFIEVDNLSKYVTNKSFQNSRQLNEYLRFWGKIPSFLELRDSPGKGYGIFALQDIEEGTFLGTYIGIPRNANNGWNCSQIYTFWMYDTRNCPCSKEKKIDNPNLWVCDAENITFANFTRFINHSEKYNCLFKNFPGNIMIFTDDPIKKGDELTIHYGNDYWKDSNVRKL